MKPGPAAGQSLARERALLRTAQTAREFLAAYDAGQPMPVTGQSDDMAWASALASCLRLILAEVPGA